MKNYYRIGVTNEGSLLFENPSTFHGVIIGANFAALYKNWLSTFLKKLKKPYFLDPRTEVFGRELSLIQKDGYFRSSFEKLINHFDNVAKNKYFSNKLKQGKLSPDDFIISSKPKRWNQKLINILVNGTLALQDEILNLDSNSNKKSIKKYMKILEELDDIDDNLNKVEYLVAPYFYFPNTYSPWFEINGKLLEATIRKSKKDVFCVLCFDKEIMNNPTEIQKILTRFKKASGFLIWINNFYEIKAEEDELIDYINFIKKLEKTGKPIINLYGSYFSLLISKKIDFGGYSRGIALGEGRDVDLPATGGGTPNRYYLKIIHNFVVEETIIKVLGRNPTFRCTCKICKPLVEEIIRKFKPTNNVELAMIFFKQMKPQMFKTHFMQVHKSEIDHILLENPNIVSELSNEIKEVDIKRLRELDIRIIHLTRWLNSITKT